ncbi:MAG: Stf0 family sulfotransferase [Dongiaceae bacterium]
MGLRDNTLELMLDERFDLPGSASLSAVYFVAFLPRSGSHFLCNRLWKTGLAGAQMEYFNLNKLPVLANRFGARHLEEYVPRLLRRRTTPNGVFGTKLNRDQFAFLQLFAFDHPLKNPKWILVDRRDKERQAISWHIANQIGAWSTLSPAQREPEHSFGAIARCRQGLIEHRRYWDGYFSANTIDPVRVVYEDLVDDPDATVGAILQHLDIPLQPTCSPVVLQIERQATSRNDEWLERFHADLAAA